MAGDEVLQRNPIQELHHDESFVLVLPDVVNGANVGMIQSRGGLRLALKSGQGLWVAEDLIGQELEGNKAMQAGVLGLVHHSHASAANLLDDLVVGDFLANHGSGMLWDDTGQVNEKPKLTAEWKMAVEKSPWRVSALAPWHPGGCAGVGYRPPSHNSGCIHLRI